jgi:nucleotide-binding universal stress UspA family protein
MEIKGVLFPTDFGEVSSDAFEYAVDIAKRYGATLYILHVIHELTKSSGLYVPERSYDEIYEYIEKEAWKKIVAVYKGRTEGIKDLKYSVIRGIPHDEILKYGEKQRIDLIVMGTLFKKKLDRFFYGSTCDKVIKGATCPVLAVPPSK